MGLFWCFFFVFLEQLNFQQNKNGGGGIKKNYDFPEKVNYQSKRKDKKREQEEALAHPVLSLLGEI